MPYNRTERQELGVQKWVDNKLCGTLVYPTGFGKSRTAIICIKRFLNKNPTSSVLIVVPTDVLQRQWVENIRVYDLESNCNVKIINSVVKQEWKVDLLIIDEAHKFASSTFSLIFIKVKYKIILGLTATFNRLDGKEYIISKYCPVIDEITIGEAISNNWLAPYREYKVFINVDISEYQEYDHEFQEHFAFFNHDLLLGLECAKSWRKRVELASIRTNNPEDRNNMLKQIIIHSKGLARTLKARKDFINNHPRKIELTNLILEHRQDKKCITFSKTIAMSRKIKYGQSLSSKDNKKKSEEILNEFSNASVGVINTSKMLDEGVDIPGLSVAIILGYDSSPTKKRQRIGRVIRYSPNKSAEIFTLVIRGTVEEKWYSTSTQGQDYLTIDESELLNVLEGKEFTTKVNKESNIVFTA